jgi:hypothetical protein
MLARGIASLARSSLVTSLFAFLYAEAGGLAPSPGLWLA